MALKTSSLIQSPSMESPIARSAPQCTGRRAVVWPRSRPRGENTHERSVLGGLLLGLVILLAIVIWSIRRHRDPDLHIECDSPIDELMPTLAGLDAGHGGGRQQGGGARERRLLRRADRPHPGGARVRALRDLPVEGGRAGPARGRCADRSGARGRAGARAAGRRRLQGRRQGRRAADARRGLPRGVLSTSGGCATSACSTTATTASWW